MTTFVRCAALLFATLPALSARWAAAADDRAADDRAAADKAALSPLQELVGSWRGVGQPRRASNQGAWTETADWSWKFAEGRATLVFTSPKAKYYRSGELSSGQKKGHFELAAKRDDDPASELFLGKLDESGQLVLVAAAGEKRPADAPARITLHTVAGGDRLLVLYEKSLPGGNRYARLAEVGYTRAGISFAKGSGQPECVVTGGVGTLAIEHQGKKYYVCCTGCRDLFNDDPEGVLADYRERKAAEKEQRPGKAE